MAESDLKIRLLTGEPLTTVLVELFSCEGFEMLGKNGTDLCGNLNPNNSVTFFSIFY